MTNIIEDGMSFRYDSSPWRMCVITDYNLPDFVEVYNLDGSGAIKYVPETPKKKSYICCCEEEVYEYQ